MTTIFEMPEYECVDCGYFTQNKDGLCACPDKRPLTPRGTFGTTTVADEAQCMVNAEDDFYGPVVRAWGQEIHSAVKAQEDAQATRFSDGEWQRRCNALADARAPDLAAQKAAYLAANGAKRTSLREEYQQRRLNNLKRCEEQVLRGIGRKI